MKSLYYILLLACVLVACKKDKNKPKTSNDCKSSCYIITGTVIDTPQKIKLSNVELKLYRQSADYSFVRSEQLITSTTTDDQGNYRFAVNSGSIDLQNNYYYIKVAKDNYFIETLADGKLYLNNLNAKMIDNPLAANITMYQPAVLYVKVETTRKLTGTYFSYTCNFGEIGMGQTVKDEDVGKVFTYKTAGGVKTYIRWNFENKQYSDWIIVEAGKSASYVIKL